MIYSQPNNEGEQALKTVDLESVDIGEKKYYLVTPGDLIFHEISFEEIHNLTQEVWVSCCPYCGEIQGYYYSKNEAKK